MDKSTHQDNAFRYFIALGNAVSVISCFVAE